MPPSNLFHTAGRTHTPPPQPLDDPAVFPAPDLDGWPRPVLIGKTAMTLPTVDGPLLAGEIKPPPEPVPSPKLISHVKGEQITRPTRLAFRGTRILAGDEAYVVPFNSRQHVLTSEFPTEATLAASATGSYPTELYGENERLPHWRIVGEQGALTGERYGTVLHAALIGGPEPAKTQEEITFPATAPTLQVEARMCFRTVRVVADDGGIREYDVADGVYWAIPDQIVLEYMAGPGYGDEPQPNLRRVVKQLSFFHTKTVAGRSETRLGTLNDDPRGTFETRWAGRIVRGYQNFPSDDHVSHPPPPDEDPKYPGYTRRPYGTIMRRYPISRLIWTQWAPETQKDPEPYDHQYEADLPGLGQVTAGGKSDTISTGTHLDHPRAQDGGFVRLGGAALAATSWAVVTRLTKDRKGPESGLLTCDGSALTVRWPGAAVATVALTDLLADVLGKGETVSDAMLESELNVYQHPDNVRLIWGAGKKAALIVPWEPWRDWTRAQWGRAKKARPRTLKAWLKVKPEDWPTGPPLPTDKVPHPTPHDLTVVGLITPPPLDSAGLPRYGVSPKIEYGPDTLGALWPWAMREQLEEPDERPDLKPERLDAYPGVPAGITVARVQGRLPEGAQWIGPKAGRAGLRMFATKTPPVLGAGKTQAVQHLATYTLPDSGEAT